MASSTRFATISEAQLDELAESMDAKNKRRPNFLRGEFLNLTCKKRTKRNKKPTQKSAMCCCLC